ncbi:MAG: pyroglutamyl-peptidase I family protein [Pseudolabrys sp.]
MISVLITGFGPFPGAPANPTGALARRLARLRHPALADVRRTAHVFSVGYAAIDHDLPRLIKEVRPQVLLMFGLAARTPYIRIETRVRNARASFPDATGRRPPGRSIVAGAPHRHMPVSAVPLLVAAREAQVPVHLSRDAGAYLCNYLCWRALDHIQASDNDMPMIAAFVHVPKLAMTARRATHRPRIAAADLERIGTRILRRLVAVARRRQTRHTNDDR